MPNIVVVGFVNLLIVHDVADIELQCWRLGPHHSLAAFQEQQLQSYDHCKAYARRLRYRIHIAMGWSKLSSVSHETSLIMCGADALFSFSTKEGNRWEKGTWPELARLAKDVPEAGIHFQGALPSMLDDFLPKLRKNPRSPLQNSTLSCFRSCTMLISTRGTYLQPQQRRQWPRDRLVQRPTLYKPMVQRSRAQLPDPPQVLDARWSRFRHSLHIRLHQHSCLLAISRLPMPFQWRRLETGCHHAHLRGS